MKIYICIFLTAASLVIKGQGSSIVFGTGTNIEVGAGADICADNITINGTFSGSGTKCCAPLPVELISLTTAVTQNSVILAWQTATEINNYGFEVERSIPGKTGEDFGEQVRNWENIGFVEGYGNSNSSKQYQFTDEKPINGINTYRLKQIDTDGSYVFSDPVNAEVKILPSEFVLFNNYPNPANPSTTIKFGLPVRSSVTLDLYSTLGEKVLEIINETKDAGYYEVKLILGNVVSGVYFYVLRARGETGMEYTSVKKMAIIK